jgi:hypothetical protein
MAQRFGAAEVMGHELALDSVDRGIAVKGLPHTNRLLLNDRWIEYDALEPRPHIRTARLPQHGEVLFQQRLEVGFDVARDCAGIGPIAHGRRQNQLGNASGVRERKKHRHPSAHGLALYLSAVDL